MCQEVSTIGMTTTEARVADMALAADMAILAIVNQFVAEVSCREVVEKTKLNTMTSMSKEEGVKELDNV